MSVRMAAIVESSSGISSSVAMSIKPMTLFHSSVTSKGAQLSITTLQLLFLSIEMTAGMPETVGLLGAKIEAMYVTSLFTLP